MLHLLAIGFFSSEASGGGEEVGTVIASPERTVVLSIVQPTASLAAAVPLGAAAWQQQYDPGDHAPFAFDFTELLAEDEKIASIAAIKLSSQAALLGISVDLTAGYGPIIDDPDGKKIQLWFVVDQASWEAVSYGAGGVLLPVTVRIITDSDPEKRYERTAVLTVRQL